MSAVLAKVCTLLFFAVAPAVLAVKFWWLRRMPWWSVLVLALGPSWLLLNLAVHFNQAHAAEVMWQLGVMEQLTPPLIDSWANDGGPLTFALVLGWLPSLLYLLPWLAIYGIAQLAPGPLRRRTLTGGRRFRDTT